MENKKYRFKRLILKASAGLLSGLIILSIATCVIDYKQRADFVKKTTNEMCSHDLDINKSAPVIARHEILIDAPIERVWNTLTSINDWRKWQSSISFVQIDSYPEKGVSFNWVSDGITFHSTIHTNRYLKTFGWTGTTWGAQAIHNWHFIQEGEKTKVTVVESLQGILVQILTGYFQDNLNTGMQTNLRELKRSCEQ